MLVNFLVAVTEYMREQFKVEKTYVGLWLEWILSIQWRKGWWSSWPQDHEARIPHTLEFKKQNSGPNWDSAVTHRPIFHPPAFPNCILPLKGYNFTK